MRIRSAFAATLTLALLTTIVRAEPAREPATSQPAADALPAAANPYEQFWVDQIAWMDQITQTLSGVQTPDDARAILPQMQTLEQQAGQFRTRIAALGPPPQDVGDACMKKYGVAIRAATQRLLVPAQRLAADPALRAILEPHMRNLAVFNATTRPAN